MSTASQRKPLNLFARAVIPVETVRGTAPTIERIQRPLKNCTKKGAGLAFDGYGKQNFGRNYRVTGRRALFSARFALACLACLSARIKLNKTPNACRRQPVRNTPNLTEKNTKQHMQLCPQTCVGLGLVSCLSRLYLLYYPSPPNKFAAWS